MERKANVSADDDQKRSNDLNDRLAKMTDRELLCHVMSEVAAIKEHLAKRTKKSCDKEPKRKRQKSDSKPKVSESVKNFNRVCSVYDREQLTLEVAMFEKAVDENFGALLERPSWNPLHNADQHIVDKHCNAIFRILQKSEYPIQIPWLFARLMAAHIQLNCGANHNLGSYSFETLEWRVKHKKLDYPIERILYLNMNRLSYKYKDIKVDLGIKEIPCDIKSDPVEVKGPNSFRFRLLVSGDTWSFNFNLNIDKLVRIKTLKEWWIHHQQIEGIAERSFIFDFRINGKQLDEETLLSQITLPASEEVHVIEIIPALMPFTVYCLHGAIVTQTSLLYKIFLDYLHPRHQMDHMPLLYYLDALSSKFCLHHESELFKIMPFIEQAVLSKMKDLYGRVTQFLKERFPQELISLIVSKYLNWHTDPITTLPSSFKWDGKNL